MDQQEDPDLLPPSPSNSSVSSSDLDTQSTGSFFPDRSTTLGTLMGVNFSPSSADAAAAVRSVRVPLRRSREGDGAVKRPAEDRRRRRSVGIGRRSWWRLCRDDMVGPTSLGDFLEIERGAADVAGFAEGHVAVGGERLFENGRVLPPALPAAERRRERVPVLLAGICSGGD